jgi:2-dehydro-3-deoxyphosphogluconate aldolase/(4S)-4-hydroxy-2-oxoglutarate aldolase
VQQTTAFGCRLVKLFPAVTVGVAYWKRLEAPMGSLPFVVAAGGLSTSDLSGWLGAGHDAVALGRRAIGDPVLGDHALDPDLLGWLNGSPTST